MKLLFALFLIIALLLGIQLERSRARINSHPATEFDLDRYLGRWYEIARYDHRFERNLSEVEANYTLLPNGEIGVVNRGIDDRTGEPREATGRARTTDIEGRLRVSFFWFFFSDYNILERGEEYEWALVGSRSPRYLWILSRERTLPPETLQQILRLAEQHGYATDRLIYVDQGEPIK